jgi:hypothetical protein
MIMMINLQNEYNIKPTNYKKFTYKCFTFQVTTEAIGAEKNICYNKPPLL